MLGMEVRRLKISIQPSCTIQYIEPLMLFTAGLFQAAYDLE